MKKKLLEKHRAFWSRKAGTGPLLSEDPHPNWHEKPFPLSGGVWEEGVRQIAAKDICIDRFLGRDCSAPRFSGGDRIPCLGPVYPQAWMEALIGCPIFVSPVSTTARPVAECSIGEIQENFSCEEILRSPWYRKLQRCIAILVDDAGDEIPVTQFHYRGIVDMLAAILGEERLCMSLYDDSRNLRGLGECYTDLYLKVADEDMAKRGLWQGGQAVAWGLYAPGKLLSYQVDGSSLFSNEMYEENFLDFDRRIVEHYPYSLIHTHYTGLHIVDSLLKIEALDALQINLDREAAPGWEIGKVIETCRKIQDHDKSVILHGELDDRELAFLLGELKGEGLAVFYWKPSTEE